MVTCVWFATTQTSVCRVFRQTSSVWFPRSCGVCCGHWWCSVSVLRGGHMWMSSRLALASLGICGNRQELAQRPVSGVLPVMRSRLRQLIPSASALLWWCDNRAVHAKLPSPTL